MRLLLDTKALLTWLDNPERLHEEGRLAIANGRNAVYVSAVSFLEIAFRESLGALEVPPDLVASLEACRFSELPLTMTQAATLRTLPPLHRDPFERVLIAQAKAEELVLVTSNANMRRYDVPVLAA